MTGGLLTLFTTYLIFPIIGLIMMGVAALVAKKNGLLKNKRIITLTTLIVTTLIGCANKPRYMSRIAGEVMVDSYMTTDGIEYYDNPQPYYQIESHGKLFTVDPDMYDNYWKTTRDTIAKSDFEYLPLDRFRERIFELYGVDIDRNNQYVIYLAPWEPADVFQVFYDGYVEVYDKEVPNLIVNVNKMILHDDIHAFNWIKAHYPHEITFQVKDMGVTTNEKWLSFAIENNDFSQQSTLEGFIFGHAPDEKMTFRKAMLDSLINHNAEMSCLSLVLEDVEYAKQQGGQSMYVENIDEIIDFLFVKICETGQMGYIESRVDHNPLLFEEFKKKNYYDIDELKFFCENYENQTERSAGGRNSNFDPYPEPILFIKDPDGYTNMRSGAGTNFDVVMQIPDGGEVKSLGLSGDWWRVTYNNTEGYVHKSRISIEGSN